MNTLFGYYWVNAVNIFRSTRPSVLFIIIDTHSSTAYPTHNRAIIQLNMHLYVVHRKLYNIKQMNSVPQTQINCSVLSLEQGQPTRAVLALLWPLCYTLAVLPHCLNHSVTYYDRSLIVYQQNKKCTHGFILLKYHNLYAYCQHEKLCKTDVLVCSHTWLQ